MHKESMPLFPDSLNPKCFARLAERSPTAEKRPGLLPGARELKQRIFFLGLPKGFAKPRLRSSSASSGRAV